MAFISSIIKWEKLYDMNRNISKYIELYNTYCYGNTFLINLNILEIENQKLEIHNLSKIISQNNILYLNISRKFLTKYI